jgi:hypothetical protein
VGIPLTWEDIDDSSVLSTQLGDYYLVTPAPSLADSVLLSADETSAEPTATCEAPGSSSARDSGRMSVPFEAGER